MTIGNEIYINYLSDLGRLVDGSKIISKVTIMKQLFFNEATGFGSFLSALEETEDRITMSGVFLDKPEPHRTYHVVGEKGSYQGRPQIRAQRCELVMPSTRVSNMMFIFSLQSISKYTAKLLEVYQHEAISKLANLPWEEIETNQEFQTYSQKEPDFFRSVSEERAYIIELFDKSNMLNKLVGLNLSKSASRKIYNLFGAKSFDKLQANPYIILEHYEDMGYDLAFCDNIAMKFNFKADDELRFEYGVLHGLNVSNQNGHVYMPKEEFIDLLMNELSVRIPEDQLHRLANEHSVDFQFNYFNASYPVSIGTIQQLLLDRANFANNAYEKTISIYVPERLLIEKALTASIQRNLAVEVDGRIYNKQLYEKECDLAKNILEHCQKAHNRARNAHSEASIKSVLNSYSLEKMQEKACIASLQGSGGLHCVIGPAGSGKTYVIKALIEAYIALNKKRPSDVLLMAPTGRAAKRIQESTQFPASTIHRALKMDPISGWMMNKQNPLGNSLVIIDEFSMVDTELAYRLFDAIKLGTKVVLVGDTNQLASVGPGNILKDILESQSVPVVELDVIKRQQEKSDIIENSVRILKKLPLYEGGKNKDAFVMFKSFNEQIQQATIASIHKIQINLSIDIEQVQVLIPQRRSRIGTYYFNHLIQAEVNTNPDSPVIANQFSVYNRTKKKYEELTTYFRIGDKVINVKNNYRAQWHDKNQFGDYVLDHDSTIVTNGEIGIIEEIIKAKRGSREKFTYRIVVRMDDKYIFFDDDFESLELAYAITVHKAQGSQWKAVIYVVSSSHKKMLTNNLMYTAMTRPSAFMAVIGDEKIINDGIQNDVVSTRYSTLKSYLTKTQ